MAEPTAILAVYRDGSLVGRHPITTSIVKLGSMASAHVRLDAPDVARMHAVIEITPDGAQIIDLGSSAGTFVDDEKVNRAALSFGCRIEIGPFILVVERPTPEPARPAPVRPPPVAGPKKLQCSWCGTALVDRTASLGGPYRSNPIPTLYCPTCALSFVDGGAIRDLLEGVEVPEAQALLERERHKLRTPCPSCQVQLWSLTYSNADAWVVFEWCDRCNVIALHDGELETLTALFESV